MLGKPPRSTGSGSGRGVQPVKTKVEKKAIKIRAVVRIFPVYEIAQFRQGFFSYNELDESLYSSWLDTGK